MTLLDAVNFSDPQVIANYLIDAASNREWSLFSVIVLIGVVAGVKKYAPRIHGRFGAFVNSDRGGIALLMFSSFLGALVTALIAKTPITPEIIGMSIITAVSAAGGWNIFNRLLWPKDPIKVKLPVPDDVPPTTPEEEVTKPGVPPSVLLLVVATGAFLLSGCACTTVQMRTDPKCVVVNKLIDCTEDAGLGGLEELLAEYLNNRASIDWTAILNRLIQAGIKDGGCILANMQQSVAASTAVGAPTRVKETQNAFVEFKKHFGIMDVKYCINPTGTKVCK